MSWAEEVVGGDAQGLKDDVEDVSVSFKSNTKPLGVLIRLLFEKMPLRLQW